MRTVIEYLEFAKKAEREFGDNERENIVSFLAQNPKAGKMLENFGGIRKVKWIRKGIKGSEFNIYFHSGLNNLPLVIIAIFKNGEKLIFDKIIEILIHTKTDQMFNRNF
jgi:hypothetical protein